jgi:hypothetical protein
MTIMHTQPRARQSRYRKRSRFAERCVGCLRRIPTSPRGFLCFDCSRHAGMPEAAACEREEFWHTMPDPART